MSNKIEPTYANWLEAFPFTIIGEMPEGNKTPPKIPAAIVDAKTAREVYGDGSFGGHTASAMLSCASCLPARSKISCTCLSLNNLCRA